MDTPWSVHDGSFFAEHVLRDKRPRAEQERRAVTDSEHLGAWLDSVGINAFDLSPFADDSRAKHSFDDDELLLRPDLGFNEHDSWTVHDGQFFAEDLLRSKQPRTQKERKLHSQGVEVYMQDGQSKFQQRKPAVDPKQKMRTQGSGNNFQMQQQQPLQQNSLLLGQHAQTVAAAQQAAQKQQQQQQQQQQQSGQQGEGSTHGTSAMLGNANAFAQKAQGQRNAPAPPCIAPLLHASGPLHQGLLDLMPQPIFVRSASGTVLYANRALVEVCGVSPGSLPKPWQIAPQFTTATHTLRLTGEDGGAGGGSTSGSVHGGEGGSVGGDTTHHELDLPLETVSPGATKPQLPPASQGCAVLLQPADHTKAPLLLAPLHRIPFWLSTDDGSGTQRASVMYVNSQMSEVHHYFPAVTPLQPAAFF